MKNATTMYRTINATIFELEGILCNGEARSIVRRQVTALYEKDFVIDGLRYFNDADGGFYPAIITDKRTVTFKCTMTEADFVKNADKVDSRFVNGRTRMVTRSVSSYSATCLCYDMEKQQMINSQFSLPEDKGADKNLQYLKKHHEEAGKFIICTVLNVHENEGIYAMTERKFFELSAHEEVIE